MPIGFGIASSHAPAVYCELDEWEPIYKMFIGDVPESMFELNIPTRREDWVGTATIIGSSGAGKTRFLTDMLLRYLKSTPDRTKRQIFWLSPELEIDKTILPEHVVPRHRH